MARIAYNIVKGAAWYALVYPIRYDKVKGWLMGRVTSDTRDWLVTYAKSEGIELDEKTPI